LLPVNCFLTSHFIDDNFKLKTITNRDNKNPRKSYNNAIADNLKSIFCNWHVEDKIILITNNALYIKNIINV